MQLKVTPIYERVRNVNKRVILLRGGTRSSKSYSLMQVVTIWLYTGQIGGEYVGKGIFGIARTTFPSLRATVMRDFIAYLHEIDIYKYIAHTKTNHEFAYQGRVVSFISTDDEHKLRGRGHTFFWLNECNDASFEVFNQIVMRLDKWIYLDANPSGHPFARVEIEEKRLLNWKERGLKESDVHVDVSTYHDNPFLPPAMVEEIEGLKFVDHDLWAIYTLGLWTELKGLIYPNIEIVPYMPIGWKTYWGADFGYNDETVLVEVAIKGKDMFIDCHVHESKLLLDEMAEKFNAIRGRPVIMCDGAEPRTIEELKRRGVRAKAAKKGADSVFRRIIFIKQHNIHITSSSVASIEEFKRFKWDEDKDGRITDKPINLYKHTSDSISYAISRAMNKTMTLLT